MAIKKLPLLLVFCVMLLHAQDRRLQKADESYDELNYSKATRLYEGVVQRGHQTPDVYERLANAYYFIADYENAAAYYDQLFAINPDPDPELYFRFAQSLKTVGDYNRSDAIMNALYQKNKMDARARLLKLRKNYRQEIRRQKDRFTLKKIKGNTVHSEFGLTWYGDEVVFTSTRDTGGAAKNRHGWDASYFQEIYRARPDTASGNLEEIRKFSSAINSRYHESSAAFSADGQRIYFTRNNTDGKKLRKDKDGITRLKILTAERLPDGGWTEPVPVSFSDDGWTVAHPALSPDGKTLYFASDMPGTKGASDIFAVAVKEDGSFGIPQPLQGVVNTEGRETFPFVANGKLYFASDGHPGLGGLDIYEAELLDPYIVGRVNNLGHPVNTRRDDFSILTDSTGQFGYIASNRWGGIGADDVYAIKANDDIIDVEGIIVDLESAEPIEDARVTLYKDEEAIDSTLTDHKGGYLFENVKNDGELRVEADKPNYTTEKLDVDRDGKYYDLGLKPALEDLVRRDLLEVLDFNDIYFDFDRAAIRPDAQTELDKIAGYLLKNAKLTLEILSFTDSRGTRAYNQKLSERRAASTAKYLIAKGVDASRIKAVGLGERHLETNCPDGVKCTKEEHQLNRRSEFYISNQPEREKVERLMAEANSQSDALAKGQRSEGAKGNAHPLESPPRVSPSDLDAIPEMRVDADAQEEAYAVQLAAYRDHEPIDLKRFDRVNNLVLEKGNDGYTRLFSGIFKDRKKADAHLQELKNKGYHGFIKTLGGP
ncbi:flagellar motor protein MotB [Robertkochia marina]|uniref:Flagellar motor protein MotB n=1 Tax=Robertkochia marina TaxID=1227945 RepID=A0A4S3M299_9FLAO|nr:OmpA family protein [Robertkochia marina]THD69244.1 flagellar motor protein MotB [Robertkochia marina]TRZ47498.1 flagellar motor protein MotB [Robertkochia marina]